MWSIFPILLLFVLGYILQKSKNFSDPTGPYGNKSLGEPPTIPVAPSIKNAMLNATGVAVNSIPLNPKKLFSQSEKP